VYIWQIKQHEIVKQILSFFIILVLISCRDSSKEISDKLIKNSNGEIYIALINDCYSDKKFDLTNEEVNQTNTILIKAIKKMQDDIDAFPMSLNPNKIKIDLNDYKRQYCACFNEQGEKVVYVNCMCRVKDEQWKKKYMTVLGGGECYFSGVINLSKNDFTKFMINAPL